MIKYYNKLILTLSEIEGHPSLLIHGLTGCMFHCFKCFNYKDLIETEHEDYYVVDDLIKYILRQKDLFDYLLFSGGEFMLASLEDLINDLSKIKAVTDKKIIIYTTGIQLEKMKVLKEKGLVDGFHIDMKLPYHLLNVEDLELVELAMGIKLKDLTLINKLIQAIDFVVETDQGLNQIRSVKYPFLDESAFDACKSYITKLNKKYDKDVPYEAHTFIYPEEDLE